MFIPFSAICADHSQASEPAADSGGEGGSSVHAASCGQRDAAQCAVLVMLMLYQPSSTCRGRGWAGAAAVLTRVAGSDLHTRRSCMAIWMTPPTRTSSAASATSSCGRVRGVWADLEWGERGGGAAARMAWHTMRPPASQCVRRAQADHDWLQPLIAAGTRCVAVAAVHTLECCYACMHAHSAPMRWPLVSGGP